MASEESDVVFTCDVCYESFNESDRRPRMLSCGHSFCGSCMNNLYVHNPCCPNCKADIQYRKPELIPINFTLESLNSKASGKLRADANVNASTKSNGTKERNPPCQGYCEEHDYPREFRCVDCNKWICGTCATLYHKNCVTVIMKDYKQMKEQISNKVADELKARKLVKQKLTRILQQFETERRLLVQTIKTKKRRLRNIEEDIGEIECELLDENSLCEKLTQLQCSVIDPTKDDEFRNIKSEVDRLLERRKKYLDKIGQEIYGLEFQRLNIWAQNGNVNNAPADGDDDLKFFH